LELIDLNQLPPEYLGRMKQMLGGEYPAFEDACSHPAFRGIRLNPLKCGEDMLKSSLPFTLRPSPFSPLGYYLPDGAEKVGKLPMHHAGAFYVQEPSASCAVTILDPQPGEKILDLCAAPGGKSTQIASLLAGRGLLWSNEIVRNRANILLSNLERIGVRNAVVSCCHPETLCRTLEGYFDRVLVDAPCSGEGMFRRSEAAVQDWSPEHVKACAVRQQAILESACRALREDGVLVYSTCTFSREENEDVIARFLECHKEFSLEDCGVSFGRPAFLPEARRVFPMDGGEGHFAAKLRKHSCCRCCVETRNRKSGPELGQAEKLWSQIFRGKPSGNIEMVHSDYFLIPDGFPKMDGLGVVRAGVLLGNLRPGRVEPAHAMFMASRPENLRNVVQLSNGSPEITAFLHGEELSVPSGLKGWCGVAVDGVTVGFGKCCGGRMKNHYPKGLRNL
jgi:16S rRNA C967 or C1407 C5-methylase (RsmB/RsmF family)/NOL1/NOP2/fmu family ribosome biogenesis protein